MCKLFVLNMMKTYPHNLVCLEGAWRDYRVVISQVYRPDGSMRYSYYVLDANNQLVYAFDNHRDKIALRLKYGQAWSDYQYEEVPHQHDSRGNIVLTGFVIFEVFLKWLQDY